MDFTLSKAVFPIVALSNGPGTGDKVALSRPASPLYEAHPSVTAPSVLAERLYPPSASGPNPA